MHALASGGALKPERTVLVVGPDAKAVSEAAKANDPSIDIVVQEDRLGTGHAVLQAVPVLDGFGGDAVILYADTPFIASQTLAGMQAARLQGNDVVVLGFETANPGRYGRLVMEGNELRRIVEFKDASESERAITLCNSGIIMAKSELIFDLCGELSTAMRAGNTTSQISSGLPATAAEGNRRNLRRRGNSRHQYPFRPRSSRSRVPAPRKECRHWKRSNADRARNGVFLA